MLIINYKTKLRNAMQEKVAILRIDLAKLQNTRCYF